MKNETIGLQGMELSEVIRELRIEQKVAQAELYVGLCSKKAYLHLESGAGVLDELLSERLMSRLHIQYKLFEIMLGDEDFWQKECRRRINRLMQQKKWEEAGLLLEEYKERALVNELHKQYVRSRQAQLLKNTDRDKAGELFREALELTMTIPELEKRRKGSGVVSEEEMWMYLEYRDCRQPLSMEEYPVLLKEMERMFLENQIYAECYFETAFQYARKLLEQEFYVQCYNVCEKTIQILKDNIKRFHLAEFYFMEAAAKMRLRHTNEEEQELFQQCKMAYYVSLSFLDEETAKKIERYSREEYGWHITG